MANWIRATFTQVVNSAKAISEWDYRTEITPTSADLFDFLTAMLASNILDAANDLQHTQVLNVSLKAVWRGNAAVNAQTPVSGGGTYAAAGSLVPQSQSCFYFKKYVGGSFDFSDDTEVTNRAIQGGALFLTGITDDWMENGFPAVPAALSTQLTDFLQLLPQPLTVGADTYQPIVHGYALPASPLPARPEVYADVVGAQFIRTSWQRRRYIAL